MIFCSFLCDPDNISGKNQRVFTYEEGNWCLKGRFDKAMKNNDTLVWSNKNGNYSLILGFVSYFFKLILNSTQMILVIPRRMMQQQNPPNYTLPALHQLQLTQPSLNLCQGLR